MKTFSAISQHVARIDGVSIDGGKLRGVRVASTHYQPEDVKVGIVVKPAQVVRIETDNTATAVSVWGMTTPDGQRSVFWRLRLSEDRA